MKFGGLQGTPNLALVESAIARPYSGYHRTIARKVAALVESIANNHGFVDGNKRTTLALMHLLPTESGYKLAVLPSDKDGETAVEEMILGSVENRLDFAQLVDWFERRIQKAP